MDNKTIKIMRTITLPSGDTITREVELPLNEVIEECIQTIQGMADEKLLDQYFPFEDEEDCDCEGCDSCGWTDDCDEEEEEEGKDDPTSSADWWKK